MHSIGHNFPVVMTLQVKFYEVRCYYVYWFHVSEAEEWDDGLKTNASQFLYWKALVQFHPF